MGICSIRWVACFTHRADRSSVPPRSFGSVGWDTCTDLSDPADHAVEMYDVFADPGTRLRVRSHPADHPHPRGKYGQIIWVLQISSLVETCADHADGSKRPPCDLHCDLTSRTCATFAGGRRSGRRMMRTSRATAGLGYLLFSLF